MISTSKHAHFTPPKKEENERKRVLTMKYGKQQIELIRKRLRVEAWLVEALEELYSNDDASPLIDIDIDEVLDIETESERRKWFQDQLKNCTASREDVQKFIAEILERLKTL